MNRTERKWAARLANRFVIVEASEAGLFWGEVDRRLGVCIREKVEETLHSLHDAHGHFVWRVIAGCCYGEYYWFTRDKDIGWWVAGIL